MTDWNRYREVDALRESGHPAEALVEFEKLRAGATEGADVSSILLGEALSYRDLGRFDKAAEAASEAVRLLALESPSRPYAEFSLACVHEGEGKFDLAVQELRSLLKKHGDLLRDNEHTPLRRNAQLRLIANLIVLGHGIEPLAILKDLRSEDLPREERAELLYREAQAHRVLEHPDEALKLFQEAVRGPLERSLAARAHFHVGEILYDKREFSLALNEFRIAEEVAEAHNPDRELFTQWINHTSKIVANDDADCFTE